MGLLARWSLNYTTEDMGSSNLNLTNVGNNIFTEYEGKNCIDFTDNQSGYLYNATGVTVPRSGGAIMFWINFNDLSVSQDIFGISSTNGYYSLIEYKSGNYFQNETLSNCNFFNSPNLGTMEVDVWYHIAVVFNNNLAYWYKNGTYIGSPSSYGSVNCSATAATEMVADIRINYLGAGAYSGNFKGRMADVRLYNHAVSEEDVYVIANKKASILSNGNVESIELNETNNLITNANRELGDNTNFEGFTGWDENEQAWYITSGASTITLSEFIPVQGNKIDNFDQYKIEAEFKQPNVSVAYSRYYFMILCYDKNFNFIDSFEVYERYSGTRTTLALSLNNGDTTVTLTDTSNWTYINDNVNHYSEKFALFPEGFEYPDFTYSYITGKYTRVDGNVLTLTSPWGGSNYAAGTSIMRTSDASTYSYIGASNALMTNDWVYRTGTSSSTQNDFSMRAGSAYFKLGWLINRNAGVETSYIRNIKVTNVTKGQVMKFGKNDIKFEEFDETTGTDSDQQAQIKDGILYINGEFIEE